MNGIQPTTNIVLYLLFVKNDENFCLQLATHDYSPLFDNVRYGITFRNVLVIPIQVRLTLLLVRLDVGVVYVADGLELAAKLIEQLFAFFLRGYLEPSVRPSTVHVETASVARLIRWLDSIRVVLHGMPHSNDLMEQSADKAIHAELQTIIFMIGMNKVELDRLVHVGLVIKI